MTHAPNPTPTWVRIISRLLRYILAGALIILIALAGALLVEEMNTSRLQARHLTDLASEIKFWMEPGPSPSIRFPRSGPYDERLGYVDLPAYLERLTARDFVIVQQARISRRMAQLVDWGLNPPYREKTQAGLTLLDCNDQPLYSVRYPERVYSRFEDVPRVLAQTLLFIENRELLDERYPKRNPAVEWDRLARAVLDQALHALDEEHETPGGSTLATQIEKYRHSPEGRTASIKEKFRQMASASVRAYLNGEQTLPVRRQLVVDYLNTVPLAAKPGYGELNGIGDGLWAWYGRDFNEVNRLLADGPGETLEEQALAYKQALSLIISQRRPSYYFGGNHQELEELTNTHLRLLASAGVIPPQLRDAALAQPLALRDEGFEPPPVSFVSRKAANAVRTSLASLLRTPRLYDLDRLDLTASSTLDARAQQAVTTVLRELRDRAAAKAAGLIEPKLLEKGDPAKVIYSFTLFERGEDANRVRVQTDNYDQPFDINEGTKLDLGSTAKLRTLVNYLEIVAGLHQRYSGRNPEELKAVPVARLDAITRWALDYLAQAQDRSLTAMLEAALERKYSASPFEQFFTGGGLHTFENFNPDDNYKVLTVREGLRDSVNLVFIRLMRDMVRHYMFNTPGSSARVLEDTSDPRRQHYLARFADREGSVFIQRFYRKYQGKSAKEAEELLVQSIRPSPKRLAAIFRTIDPEAGEDKFARFLSTYLPSADISDKTVKKLYEDYSPQKFNLADRGYLAGIHPLELWVVGFLRSHPGATLTQTLAASADERQAVYAWLFKTRYKNRQDIRIKQLLEVEGFLEMHKAWKRVGYPFDSLVPSYATTLGASADRPAALAELMGILINEGVRLPTVRIEGLHFAAATPFETVLARKPNQGEQVLAPEVARVARKALAEVVEQGTARRLRGAYNSADGASIPVGGKTGTGDHRFESYGRGGVLISSKVISRSGTFVFFIGERYFGTLTAYVQGPEAASYKFTSGLPVQILKVLAPTLAGFVDPAREAGLCRQGKAELLTASVR